MQHESGTIHIVIGPDDISQNIRQNEILFGMTKTVQVDLGLVGERIGKAKDGMNCLPVFKTHIPVRIDLHGVEIGG